MQKKQYYKCLDIEIGKGLKRFIKIHTNNSCRAIYYIRKSEYYFDKGLIRKTLSKHYVNMLGRQYGIFISPANSIGIGLKLPHPTGIIIGEAVDIGENCTIYQQVTIGSAHTGDFKKGLQPKIGNNVTLFAGAKIIGDINLADGTTVGANAVLTKDTESNSTYVGVPAKRIK